ncbi:MAG TPA: hypothetical protein VGN82_16725 [Bosea sp. (in: a-proteobacteria)]|jgi:hypothetical protein|uniref:hypothetical protein n=1 Tax=Bosea sp. (in: a-proteobacteria) TaxID=1871050 RepID=UPI002E100DB6|nr:hypothetical protein [Bosea sp. (in: a-proteobacteria)]
MQSFTTQQIIENRRAFRQRHFALLRQQAGDRMIAALDRLVALIAKGGFNPNQPRVPAGNPEGGQWGDGSGQHPDAIPLLSDFLAAFPDAIAGAASGLELPSPADGPGIPASQPRTAQGITAVVKDSARWLQSAKDTRASSQARGFFSQLLDTSWLRSHMPRIGSYLDDPKTEQELHDAVSRPSAGFDIHHRNERAAATVAGYPSSMINGRPNLMLVPTLRHWDVSGWYMTRNSEFGGLTPRQFLSDKDWNTRQAIGNRALRLYGILKP